MDLEIEPVRNNLCTVQLNMPYDLPTVIREFENEVWRQHSDSENRAGDPHAFRSVLANPSSSILKEILSFLSSNEVKRQVINTIYDLFPDTQCHWDGWSTDKLFDVTLWGGQFLKDEPGYYIPPHIDTRIQVFTLLMYFIDENDSDQATTFYTDKYKTNPWTATTGLGRGILHVNDYDTWHEGHNKSSKTRYLVNLGLLINV